MRSGALYEMVTGKRASQDRGPLEPASLDSIVRTCMEQDPEQRWQSARDIREAMTLPAPPVPKPRPLWPWAAALCVMGVLAAAGWWIAFRSPTATERSYRLSVLPPEGTNFVFSAASGSHALSPDGRTLAFVGETQGATHLWLRPLDSTTSRRLDGTDQAYGVSWSPDGRFLAFPTPANSEESNSPRGS